ncbi:dolichyl-diphosphooligosaccharide--protein glycosyltransferase subunit 2 [Condylostylus longicornis]|uniref:dolichyl-diphosphooligosaccharide--protein glycosyltransferase subunit 2 n=1 Tax=Condylostylus longicornis TaxID=2530218 RepID=UPI00244E4C2E|nr:dolichyl-diphosphooligosaccharide--protein glycosyltransferase subunit 2 [Condylostylus longicornis]
MLKLVLGLFLLAYSVSCVPSRTVSDHLSSIHRQRFEKVFAEGISSNDLQTVYYAAINHEKITQDEKTNLCKRILEVHAESKLNDFEKNFYLVGTYKHLKCSTQLPQNVLNAISTSLGKDVSTAQEMFFNLFSSKVMGIKIDKTTTEKLAKNLQNILKKDDSLSSLGYAFFIGAEFGNQASFVAERIEDAIVQADEVDGKMLQFEGGLSITALIINGAFKVTKSLNKPSPISEEQAVKFATYFLSRRSVQAAKGAHVLLEALKTLSDDKSIAPICIQLIGNGQLESSTPVLNIKVLDLLGRPLTQPISAISAKIVVKKGNTVLAEKVQFASKDSTKTVYSADLSSYKPTRGIYTIDIAADKYSQTLNFKVLGKVKVHSLEIGVGDSDASSSLKKLAVVYPSKLGQVLTADHTQKLVLKIALVDEGTTKTITVHQAFVRLLNVENDNEIIFVAEQDTTKAYKFDMDVGTRGGDFGYKSGLYKIEVIIGDASLSNSFQWHVADVQLKFSQDAKTDQTSKPRTMLPEITHKFREPEKRPSRFLSDIFTGLCLTPLVLLFIIWAKLGINVSNFSFNLSTIGFHLGFGAILGLFAVFWLQLNMFETIRYLIPIAILTFLCGNRLLRTIAAGQK